MMEFASEIIMELRGKVRIIGQCTYLEKGMQARYFPLYHGKFMKLVHACDVQTNYVFACVQVIT